MIPYDLIITSCADRRDLLARTVRSALTMLDVAPARVIIHEDVRPDREVPPNDMGEVVADFIKTPIMWMRTEPAGGLARAMLRLVEAAQTEFVLYTQEDFDFLRPVPVAAALDVMTRHGLHHVRFNKRQTMRVKGEHRDPSEWWTKREVEYDGHALCLSDNWYFQPALNRRSVLLDGFRAVCERRGPIDHAEIKFQRWFHGGIGKGAGTTDGAQDQRLAHCRTFIWGPVNEPAFVEHTGSVRRTQGWEDAAHDRKFGTTRGERP